MPLDFRLRLYIVRNKIHSLFGTLNEKDDQLYFSLRDVAYLFDKPETWGSTASHVLSTLRKPPPPPPTPPTANRRDRDHHHLHLQDQQSRTAASDHRHHRRQRQQGKPSETTPRRPDPETPMLSHGHLIELLVKNHKRVREADFLLKVLRDEGCVLPQARGEDDVIDDARACECARFRGVPFKKWIRTLVSQKKNSNNNSRNSNNNSRNNNNNNTAAAVPRTPRGHVDEDCCYYYPIRMRLRFDKFLHPHHRQLLGTVGRDGQAYWTLLDVACFLKKRTSDRWERKHMTHRLKDVALIPDPKREDYPVIGQRDLVALLLKMLTEPEEEEEQHDVAEIIYLARLLNSRRYGTAVTYRGIHYNEHVLIDCPCASFRGIGFEDWFRNHQGELFRYYSCAFTEPPDSKLLPPAPPPGLDCPREEERIFFFFFFFFFRKCVYILRGFDISTKRSLENITLTVASWIKSES